jgi:hypothetical protein
VTQERNTRRRVTLAAIAAATALLAACAPRVADVINGTPQADHLRGTNSSDLLRALWPRPPKGRRGDDRLFGCPGRDDVSDGSGADVVRLGPGDDITSLRVGRDRMYGDEGSEWLSSDTTGYRTGWCGAVDATW